MPAGRPSIYSEKLSKKILRGLESGKSLRELTKPDDMPDRHTVIAWRRQDEEFSTQYERAWTVGMEARADKVREIGENATPENVQVAKLQCDNEKWLMARIGRGRFGDKQTVTHEAPAGFSFTMSSPKDKDNGSID